MTNVWAYREGEYRVEKSAEWDIAVRFAEQPPPARWGPRDPGLNDLIDRLSEQHLEHGIDRLAIVSHGSPGRIYTNGKFNAPSISQHFTDMATFVRKGGLLSFESCDAGQGAYGDMFLIAVSKNLPNRVIVGYEIDGYVSFYPSTAGQVPEIPDGKEPKPGAPNLDPWNGHAKWAFNGVIVRKPVIEQKMEPRKRCANPGCRGHASEVDRCPYRSWGSNPILLRYGP